MFGTTMLLQKKSKVLIPSKSSGGNIEATTATFARKVKVVPLLQKKLIYGFF